jgi:hypothetical protein
MDSAGVKPDIFVAPSFQFLTVPSACKVMIDVRAVAILVWSSPVDSEMNSGSGQQGLSMASLVRKAEAKQDNGIKAATATDVLTVDLKPAPNTRVAQTG